MTWLTYKTKNKLKQLNIPPGENNSSRWIACALATTFAIFVFLSPFTHSNSLRTTFVLNLESDLPCHTVSEYFLSFAIDASLFRTMTNLPILNKKLIYLARHLSPAYIRFGGTSADCLFFNETFTSEGINIVNGEDISKFTISEKDFYTLYEFSKWSNLKMIFDLNVLIRNSDGSWNDSNAQDIIRFAKLQNMNIDWQLGNEPPNFPLLFNLTIPPEQLAKDYQHLRFLLNSNGYKNSILVGPEVNQVGGPLSHGENYTREFLKTAKDSINYVTWHQYYMRGEDAKVNDFVNVTTFNYLPYLIKSMKEAVNSSGNNLPMWLSETSTAFDGGAPGISDRFIAGFLWLDKLGYSAKAGVQVVIRQTLFGGNYGMISYLRPNPDWWISVIYKKLVSNKVLVDRDPYDFETIRLYIHCTPEKIHPNSITIFGVNIDRYERKISTRNVPVLNTSKSLLYILTSDDLLSRSIRLNGEELEVLSHGRLPLFKPIIVEKEEIITLPRFSMFFIVVQDVNLSSCSNVSKQNNL